MEGSRARLLCHALIKKVFTQGNAINIPQQQLGKEGVVENNFPSDDYDPRGKNFAKLS